MLLEQGKHAGVFFEEIGMDERGAYQKSILLSWRNVLPKKGIICVLLCEKGSRCRMLWIAEVQSFALNEIDFLHMPRTMR